MIYNTYYSFMHINTKCFMVNLDVQAGTVSTTSSQSHQIILNRVCRLKWRNKWRKNGGTDIFYGFVQ